MNPSFGTYALLAIIVVAGVSVPASVILRAWVVDATMDAALAVCCLAALFVLVSFILATQGTVWTFVGLIVLILCGALSPGFSTRVERSISKQLDSAEIERYERAIARDPNNASAYALLAEALVRFKRPEDAIPLYRSAISLAPHGPRSAEWKTKLRSLLRDQEEGPQLDVCTTCGRDLGPGVTTCPSCGTVMRLGFFEWFKNPAVHRDIAKQTFAFTMVMVIALTLVSSLSIEGKACIAMSTVIVGGWYFLKGIQG